MTDAPRREGQGGARAARVGAAPRARAVRDLGGGGETTGWNAAQRPRPAPRRHRAAPPVPLPPLLPLFGEPCPVRCVCCALCACIIAFFRPLVTPAPPPHHQDTHHPTPTTKACGSFPPWRFSSARLIPHAFFWHSAVPCPPVLFCPPLALCCGLLLRPSPPLLCGPTRATHNFVRAGDPSVIRSHSDLDPSSSSPSLPPSSNLTHTHIPPTLQSFASPLPHSSSQSLQFSLSLPPQERRQSPPLPSPSSTATTATTIRYTSTKTSGGAGASAL